MITAIVTIYRARVDYDLEVDADIEGEIESRVLSFKAKNLDVVCWHGCPCCSPYIVVEGESKTAVAKFVAKVERYINRRKGAKVTA